MVRARKYNWDEVVQLYVDLGNASEVARVTGISKAGVLNILRRVGINVSRVQKDINYEQLYREHCGGKSLTDLSKEYGVSIPTISQCFKRRGLKTHIHPHKEPAASPLTNKDKESKD
ncbi:MAG: hypothetical protein UY48_C0008G0048 [Candidatus Gottesmanbacteria bacterium GW2011_GWB1_49_7]|uniref:Uncharacterized protein n=1 Tax=Candidatus Gottesmanbacteria bacterium GW2011_GWB1_49_7 TaxID=1618448 RepID=A0A0G1W2D5_9BACT|nr:MAG: hypothetical protein UY48_C0008G0048 [Candidatus Gottesmanbacteria bacterium GW2011_GWB1_49_7]